MSDRNRAPKQRNTIDNFFKQKSETLLVPITVTDDACSSKAQRVEPESEEIDVAPHEDQIVELNIIAVGVDVVERDPGIRIQICEHPINQQDDVRRAYLKMGPYQPIQEYPPTKIGRQNRRFNASWFKLFSWLEYSPKKDKAYCFPCFLFETNPPRRSTFTVDGFKSWKRVNDGDKCVFLQHVGGPCSLHMSAVNSCEALMNPSQHINRVMNALSKEEILKNRLRLKTTIKSVRWLALQGCAFRGHDESDKSENCGNFIELLKFSAELNEEVGSVVLKNAPGNATYTSPDIQKQVLHILAEAVRKKIREEVGDAKFCILVDEAQDNSNKEQMAIILRFVDSDGFVRERFFGIVGVEETSALTLKREISDVLTRYNLHIDNLRGQGYDGASNMRGAWNGLQALFLKECPYAYYVHCFAHRLQLALVAASKDVHDVWLFFSKLAIIVNIIDGSPKRRSELQVAQEDEVKKLIASGELETGKGLNQIRNLQRAGATRWSSHFASVGSLLSIFNAVGKVIGNVVKNGSTSSMRGEAKGAQLQMVSFEFVFILHVLHKTMGITDILCQALQEKAQDILHAMSLVSTTKTLLEKLKETWTDFLENILSFCRKHGIDMPDMGRRYMTGTGRSSQQRDNITVEHHYHFDIFIAIIDYQVVELKNRFTEEAMEILTLSSALNPCDGFRLFNTDDICTLANKFYPQDFTKQEINILRSQLQHYELDIPHHSHFQNMSTISKLCRGLIETRKSMSYNLVDRLVRLVLTLPVSTATTERAFSAMKLVKTQLRNKMEDGFLADCMVVYIEREFAKKIDIDWMIDEFDTVHDRRVQLR